jgi:CheY-like chemotaxis protein
LTSVKGRVFLVEDEDLISMLTEDMLADLGYDVAATAADLESGLSAAASDSFDVAVLDINLHGSASYPIAEVLEGRGIPFVFVSGYIGKGIDPRFIAAPTLQKPFTAEALGAVLERASSVK